MPLRECGDCCPPLVSRSYEPQLPLPPNLLSQSNNSSTTFPALTSLRTASRVFSSGLLHPFITASKDYTLRPATTRVKSILGFKPFPVIFLAWGDLQVLTRQFRPYNSLSNDLVRQYLLNRVNAILSAKEIPGFATLQDESGGYEGTVELIDEGGVPGKPGSNTTYTGKFGGGIFWERRAMVLLWTSR